MTFSANVQKVLRSEWNGLPDAERRRLLREGATVVNDPPKPRAPVILEGGAVLRSDWEKMDAKARRDHVKAGKAVVNG